MSDNNNKSFIDVFADDFVVHLSTATSLNKLDSELKKYDLESFIYAPAEYSIKQILDENYCKQAKKSCLGLGLIHSNGITTKTGGQVIKNVSGYDLSTIYIGSNGKYTNIDSAYLRLRKLPKWQLEICYQYQSLDNLQEEILGSLNHQNSLVPEWDNYSAKVIPNTLNNSIELIYNLYGDPELLELRKNKIIAKLGSPHSLNEGKYQQKNYPKNAYKVEFNSIYPDAFDIFKLCKASFSTSLIELDLISKSIVIYYSDTNDFEAQAIPNLESFFKEQAHLLSTKDFYLQLYPQNQTNQELQDKLNLHNNDFEDKIINELKGAFH